MAEIVSLAKYRLAKATCAECERARKWNGFRFGDITDLSYFQFPAVYGTNEIFLKLDEVSAGVWGTVLENGPAASVAIPILLPTELPVILIDEPSII